MHRSVPFCVSLNSSVPVCVCLCLSALLSVLKDRGARGFPWGLEQWDDVIEAAAKLQPGFSKMTAKGVRRKFKNGMVNYKPRTGQNTMPQFAKVAADIWEAAQALVANGDVLVNEPEDDGTEASAYEEEDGDYEGLDDEEEQQSAL